MSTNESITYLLRMWQDGTSESEELLYHKILPTLRKQARMVRNKHNGMLELDTTEIIHETYMKLDDIKQLSFNDRAHFFAISAKVIRRLVIDYMRRQTSLKRGGRIPLISLDCLGDEANKTYDPHIDWIMIEQAINELNRADETCAKVVEMKFFSAMTLEEMATVCQCSVMTIRRKWRFAKVWLTTRLSDTQG